MNPDIVVKLEIFGQSCSRLVNINIIMKKDIFILDRPPESFGENVIQAASASVHADLNFFSFQNRNVIFRRVMDALVGIMDVRHGDFQSFLERLNTESIFKCWRKLPRQDVTGMPVDNGSQIDEAVFQFYVSDVGAPDLIGTNNFESF